MKLADHIERISADPDNPEAYLVFADWLQERGDPWGTLIVLQQQLEERPGDASVATAIEALIKKHSWVPKHKTDVMRLAWRWGFIHTVRFFDAYGSAKITALAQAVRESPMAPLVRRCEVFRQADREGDDAREVEKLGKAFPHADIAFIAERRLGELEDKKARAAARYLEVATDHWNRVDECVAATWIECRGITELPESLGALPLERLDIDWCHRLRSIPDVIWGIESLGYISMYDCDELGLNMGRVNHLVSGFVRARTPREQRIYESRLFRGGGVADRQRLMFAVDNNVAQVRTRALELLEEVIEPPEPAIAEGSVVATLGRFNLEKKAIKKRLEALGATIKTRINAQTTHVLLGEAPGGKQHDIGELPVALERHLTATKAAKGGKSTKAAGARPSAGAINIARLAADLRSKKDARITGAVAALQEHGAIPRELVAELFCVMSDTRLEKLGKGRKNARKLFAALAPAALRKAVAAHFKTSVLLAGESKIAARVAALEKAAGAHIDIARLARLLSEDYGCGLKLILERGDAAEIRWAIDRRIVKKHLDIAGLELDNLPDLSGTDLVAIDASNNHLSSFPSELAALPRLAALKLGDNYLRALPKKLDGFAALKTLDLSCNRFQTFPRGVVTLPALEELDLSADTWGETRITKIPKEVAELQSLRTLRIDNGHVAVEVPDEIAALEKLETFAVTWAGRSGKPPAALRKLLPNCKIT